MIRERRSDLRPPFVLSGFTGRGVSSAPQKGDFADVTGIKDVNSVAYIDNDSRFVFGEENLLVVANYDYFPIHAELKRAERSRLQGSLEIHRFHALNLPTSDTSASLSPSLNNLRMFLVLPPHCAAGRIALAR
jgi:hypothetical protein